MYILYMYIYTHTPNAAALQSCWIKIKLILDPATQVQFPLPHGIAAASARISCSPSPRVAFLLAPSCMAFWPLTPPHPPTLPPPLYQYTPTPRPPPGPLRPATPYPRRLRFPPPSPLAPCRRPRVTLPYQPPLVGPRPPVLNSSRREWAIFLTLFELCYIYFFFVNRLKVRVFIII